MADSASLMRSTTERATRPKGLYHTPLQSQRSANHSKHLRPLTEPLLRYGRGHDAEVSEWLGTKLRTGAWRGTRILFSSAP